MKTILSVLLLFFVFQSFAQDFTYIRGKVMDDNLQEVKLFRTVDGKPIEQARSVKSADGSFGFAFVPDASGFYALGTDKINFMIYVKGGEEINIDLHGTKAVLNGKNTKENESLYAWEDYAAPIRLKSVFFYLTHSNYKDFFPEFEKFLAGRPALERKLKSGNEEFDRLLDQLVQYETDFFAVSLLFTPRTVHPQKSEWLDFYRTIPSETKFADDVVLNYPTGVRMMSAYASFCTMAAGKKLESSDEYVQSALSFLHNDRLKGEYILESSLSRNKSYDQFQEGMQKYGRYLVTPSLKARAEEIGTRLYTTKPGGKAADFTYPDAEGRMHSLSGFKGKVVLVDVWATWCGPCRKQLPYLKKLGEEMAGKDLVILGVSVDEQKNLKKWKETVKAEGLPGVQLFADGWSKITKDYKINGIPRFMVFDKKGNIVTIDAPRPSDPKLKALLESELKK